MKSDTRIGVISDTHGHLDLKVKAYFNGVDHILHAGDIGLPWLILELEDIAPVTAVSGNTDFDLEYPETELVAIGERRFLVHHVVDLPTPKNPVRSRIIRENPDVVVFGHTHQRHCKMMGKTLYFNPGYAGQKRCHGPRSVGILHCDAEGMTAEFKTLDG